MEQLCFDGTRGRADRRSRRKLLRALLLQVLYTIERQLIEQIDYNLLYLDRCSRR